MGLLNLEKLYLNFFIFFLIFPLDILLEIRKKLQNFHFLIRFCCGYYTLFKKNLHLGLESR